MHCPQKTLKKTIIKLYNTLALPVLLFGSETWTVKASDARRITAAEMKCVRTTGYTWTDYKTNAQIAKELKMKPILDKLLEYKRSWIKHVNRMPRNRSPRVMKYCSPTGRRNHGRPLKRLLDTWDRNGPTSGPTPWKIWWWWWGLLSIDSPSWPFRSRRLEQTVTRDGGYYSTMFQYVIGGLLSYIPYEELCLLWILKSGCYGRNLKRPVL